MGQVFEKWPDGELKNDSRAEKIDNALNAYWGEQGEEENETILTDMLNDIFHYCDRDVLDFFDLVERARLSYEAEYNREQERKDNGQFGVGA
jgi:hypothetical protein